LEFTRVKVGFLDQQKDGIAVSLEESDLIFHFSGSEYTTTPPARPLHLLQHLIQEPEHLPSMEGELAEVLSQLGELLEELLCSSDKHWRLTPRSPPPSAQPLPTPL
jgi:hypothetical protein